MEKATEIKTAAALIREILNETENLPSAYIPVEIDGRSIKSVKLTNGPRYKIIIKLND